MNEELPKNNLPKQGEEPLRWWQGWNALLGMMLFVALEYALWFAADNIGRDQWRRGEPPAIGFFLVLVMCPGALITFPACIILAASINRWLDGDGGEK